MEREHLLELLSLIEEAKGTQRLEPISVWARHHLEVTDAKSKLNEHLAEVFDRIENGLSSTLGLGPDR